MISVFIKSLRRGLLVLLAAQLAVPNLRATEVPNPYQPSQVMSPSKLPSCQVQFFSMAFAELHQHVAAALGDLRHMGKIDYYWARSPQDRFGFALPVLTLKENRRRRIVLATAENEAEQMQILRMIDQLELSVKKATSAASAAPDGVIAANLAVPITGWPARSKRFASYTRLACKVGSCLLSGLVGGGISIVLRLMLPDASPNTKGVIDFAGFLAGTAVFTLGFFKTDKIKSSHGKARAKVIIDSVATARDRLRAWPEHDDREFVELIVLPWGSALSDQDIEGLGLQRSGGT